MVLCSIEMRRDEFLRILTIFLKTVRSREFVICLRILKRLATNSQSIVQHFALHSTTRRPRYVRLVQERAACGDGPLCLVTPRQVTVARVKTYDGKRIGQKLSRNRK